MNHHTLDLGGLVEATRPGPRTAELRRRGIDTTTGAVLCTACLVGTWPLGIYRQSQTLCDACRAVDVAVAERAGLPDGTAAGRFPDGKGRFGGLHDLADPDWEPIRRAHAYRRSLLERVFVQARALDLTRLVERRPGLPPRELVRVDDLRRHDLLVAEPEARVTRFARWTAALDPAGYAARADVLADVVPLARTLRLAERDARRRRARRDLERVAREAVAAPRAVLDAVRQVVAAERPVR
ncbi:hypothetical protein ATJ88_2983 [Isoptericola jiangsuensis]|uniref:Uncharacterized protein n=1 Tax=Isoptericola jiangsuensis TaxID=548579 RepID=A0A2A9EZT9_9MICO|nr:hypothetical protein [Isoptericola jiangsuensis]PFG44263.1 hypothetical protein ATJ88_2983 [Isoptericola jiangsuensis]